MDNITLTDFTVNCILAVNRLSRQRNDEYSCVERNYCSLVFKKEGRSIYKTGNRKYVSDAHHVMLLLRGSSYHHLVEEFGECIMINFECNEKYMEQGIKSFYLKNSTLICNLFYAIEREWTFKKFGYVNKCFSKLYEILSLLEQSEHSMFISESKLEIIKPAVEYLENHYCDPELNIDILAKQANISSPYFRKLFTNVYMIPPAKYLQNIRISKAKDLLIGNSHSISEISEMIGYSSIYYFSSIFKKETGLSPSEFLRQHLVKSGFKSKA